MKKLIIAILFCFSAVFASAQIHTYFYQYDKAKKLIKISVNLHNTPAFQKCFEYVFYK
jgi:hypothetical protein